MWLSFFSTLFLITAINGAILISILLSKSWKKINAHTFLSLLLLIISLYQFKQFIVIKGYFASFPHLMAVFVPALYLLGPLYFFYVSFSVKQRVKLRKQDLIHVIPSIICFLTILPFYLKSGAEKLSMYHAPHPENFHLSSNRAIYYGLILLSMFFYAYKSLSLINSKYKAIDKRTVKSLRNQLAWLKYYTQAFLFFLLGFLAAQLIFIFTDFYQYYVMLFTVLSSSILIHFIGYWAIKKSSITNNQDEGNVKKITLSEKKVQELKADILEMMIKKRVYLQSDLDARYFCEQLSVNTMYLSQLINNEFNCTLTHLINSYRIESAKELILSEKHTHLNFLGIATEVGFNNKNTFTRSFKRHTGMTPSEYRNSILKD